MKLFLGTKWAYVQAASLSLLLSACAREEVDKRLGMPSKTESTLSLATSSVVAGTLLWKVNAIHCGMSTGSVAVDTADNIYASGCFDGRVVKLSPAGSILWTSPALTDGLIGNGNSLAVDKSGNVFAVGIRSMGGSSAAGFIAKLNVNGTIAWNHDVPWLGRYFRLSAVTVDGTGNIYAAGTSAPNNGRPFGVRVMKLDPTGRILWQQDKDIPLSQFYGEAVDVVLTSRGLAVAHSSEYSLRNTETGSSIWSAPATATGGVSKDASENLYFVADNNRIDVFSIDGSPLPPIKVQFPDRVPVTPAVADLAIDPTSKTIYTTGISVPKAGAAWDMRTAGLRLDGSVVWQAINGRRSTHEYGLAVSLTKDAVISVGDCASDGLCILKYAK